jgi:DNA-binding NtrC family response regulator
MNVQRKRIDHKPSTVGVGRVPVVFVSASTEDARVFREIADASRSLVVNVPDLTGAHAVMEKLCAGLVACDTEIEGPGCWRDLLRQHSAHPGWAFVVVSRDADEALWAEVLNLGGLDLLAKPLAVEDVERAIGLGLQYVRGERGVVARKSVLHTAQWSHCAQSDPHQ